MGRRRKTVADPFGHGHDIWVAPYRVVKSGDGWRSEPVRFEDGCELLGHNIGDESATEVCTWWRSAGDDQVWAYCR